MCKGIVAIAYIIYIMIFHDILSSDAIVILFLLSLALLGASVDDGMRCKMQKQNDDKVREDSDQEK